MISEEEEDFEVAPVLLSDLVSMNLCVLID